MDKNIDWYIYEGNGTTSLEDIKDKKPKMARQKVT